MTLREYLTKQYNDGKFVTGSSLDQSTEGLFKYRSHDGNACVIGHAAHYLDIAPHAVESKYLSKTSDINFEPITLNDEGFFRLAISLLCDAIEPTRGSDDE